MAKNKRELTNLEGQNLKELLLDNDGEFLVAFKRVIGPLFSMSIIIPYIAWSVIVWKINTSIFGNLPSIIGDIALIVVFGIAMFMKYCIREDDETFTSRVQCPFAAMMFMLLFGTVSIGSSWVLAKLASACLGQGEMILLPMIMNLCLKALICLWMWGVIAPTEESSVIKEKIKNEQVIVKVKSTPIDTEEETESKKKTSTKTVEKKKVVKTEISTEEADDEHAEENPSIKKKEAELAAAFFAGDSKESA